jgi:hypothetical protein
LEQSEFDDFSDFYVINSIIIPDSIIGINISKSLALDKVSFQYVEEANIDLYRDGIYMERLTYQEGGNYLSEHIAREGVPYTYAITLPSNEKVSINKTIPIQKKLINIRHIEEASVDEEGTTIPAFILNIENNPEEDLYFHVIIRLKKYEGMSQADLIQVEDELILREGIPIPNISNQGIEVDNFNLQLNYITGNSGSRNDSGNKTTLFPTVLELRSGDESYFEYIKENYIYTTTNTPSLDGTNQPGLDNYYEVYSKHIIGVNLAYSTFISDTIYLETTF